ncbi:concanavalin A-like lectin/glucanase domain-containing protein [Mycena leptocephala]|nr:concanavalin A-like lectin/glucanase domain-containing protein [Mycena leptocephala]
MKAAAITAILAASLATAEVTWTFQSRPQTRFQSQAMAKVGEARKRNRLNGRASGATVQSSNWCGAALTGSGFTSVVGTWTIPTISLRSASPARTPHLQWGGTLSNSSGRQENVAWTEMLPAASRDVSLTVATGDSITTNVTMTSTTSGTVTIENNTRRTSIVGTVSGGTRLSATSAEWILEDFESGSSLVAFAGFPTSTFTGSALRSGTSTSPSTSTLIDLVQGSSELCSATISGTTVSVRDS